MDINPEIRERILNAAQQLFEGSGRLELPTVDAVRRLSKTNMNDASAVMKEWRRLQIVSASAAVVSVPDRVQQASQSALSTLWTEAQELANEGLNVAQAAWDAERAEAEKLRVELSSAFEAQGAELEALRVKLGEVEAEALAAAAAAEKAQGESARQVAALTDQAHTAAARVQEIEKRAEDLKAVLSTAQESVQRLTTELEALRIKLAESEAGALAAAAAAEKEREESARQVAALTDQAHTALARVQEIEKRAEDLKAALSAAQGSAQRLTAELEAERGQHGATRERIAALTTELVTVKARAEAQAAVQTDQAERLKQVEGELTSARSAASAAREEAAQLRGQAEALHTQHAELMRVIEAREGERPKGSKK